MPQRAVERVVLLGYMCSGKSTVGEALARRLDWVFLDFDVEIERRENRQIARIIDEQGEEVFREMEAALTEEVADQARIVIAPGGGWITQPRLLEAIRPGTMAAWLRVSPAETVRRLNTDGTDRPLKGDPDAAERIAAMLEERMPLYRLADLSVPSDHRRVQDLAFELEQMVRTRNAAVGFEI